MTEEESNLRVIDTLYEAINAKDWDRAFGLHSKEHLRFDMRSPEPMKGLDTYREFTFASVRPFPDLRVEVVNVFGQGEWVCDEHITTGTHTIPLNAPGGQTIPATDKKFRVKSCHIYKLMQGIIVETRVYSDQTGLLAQLGLAPGG